MSLLSCHARKQGIWSLWRRGDKRESQKESPLTSGLSF